MAQMARFLAICLVVFAVFSPVRGQPDDSTDARVGAIFTGLIRPTEPGAAVLINGDGKIVFERGYGLRGIRSGEKIDPQTNFRLASVTKQFTAMAIMLLVHDGKLHYGDHLTDIFPDFPAYGKPITLRHLLNHTSGLPEYEELMERESVTGAKSGAPTIRFTMETCCDCWKPNP